MSPNTIAASHPSATHGLLATVLAGGAGRRFGGISFTPGGTVFCGRRFGGIKTTPISAPPA